jgi:hypothetical protein
VVLEEVKVGVPEAASILKRYLSSVPSGLLPEDLLPQLGEELPTVEGLKKIVEGMPPEKATLLEFVFSMLR